MASARACSVCAGCRLSRVALLFNYPPGPCSNHAKVDLAASGVDLNQQKNMYKKKARGRPRSHIGRDRYSSPGLCTYAQLRITLRIKYALTFTTFHARCTPGVAVARIILNNFNSARCLKFILLVCCCCCFFLFSFFFLPFCSVLFVFFFFFPTPSHILRAIRASSFDSEFRIVAQREERERESGRAELAIIYFITVTYSR